jgi:hypothetical protein
MDMDNDSDAEGRAWEDPEDSESSSDHSGADKESDDADADAEYAEYEKAHETYMMLSAAEKAILTDDARELALAEEADREEDEEIKKLSDMMEAELFGHGALNLDPEQRQKSQGAKSHPSQPSQPITSAKGKRKAKVEELPEEDADSDNSDDDVLDDDYNLAENMLKAFKGQVGMAGPAGNLMGLMGVQFPPDADDERKSRTKGKAPLR